MIFEEAVCEDAYRDVGGRAASGTSGREPDGKDNLCANAQSICVSPTHASTRRRFLAYFFVADDKDVGRLKGERKCLKLYKTLNKTTSASGYFPPHTPDMACRNISNAISSFCWCVVCLSPSCFKTNSAVSTTR